MIQHQRRALGGFLGSALYLASLAATGCAHGQKSPPCCPSYVRPALVGTNVTEAAPRTSPDYASRHARRVRKSRERRFPFVLVGDSLTDMWTAAAGQGGIDAWNRVFAPRGGGFVSGFQADDGAALYGFGGDTTGNLLWRLDGGELDGLGAPDNPQPTRVVVVTIGTNNLRDTPENIAVGVEAVVQAVRCRVPTARVLLVGLLPRQSGERLAKVVSVNQLIRRLDDGGRTVRFLDVGSHFIDASGALRAELYRDDTIHLSSAGYDAWAAALTPALDEMLRAPPRACGR